MRRVFFMNLLCLFFIEINANEDVQSDLALLKNFFDKGDYDSIISIVENGFIKNKDIKFNDEVEYKKHLAKSYLKLGLYKEALETITDLEKKCEKIGSNKNKADSKNLMGLYFYALEEFNKAQKLYQEAADIRIEIKDTTGIIESYNNLGVIAKKEERFQEALNYYNRALELLTLRKEFNSLYVLGLNNIANVYKKLEKYDTALRYLFKALKISEENGFEYNIALCSHNIGGAYYSSENYLAAATYFNRAFLITKELRSPQLSNLAIRNLSNVYVKLGNLEKANEFLRLYIKHSEDELNSKMDRQLVLMQTRFETIEKDKEILLLENEKKLSDIRKKILYCSIAGVIVLALLLSYFQRRKLLQEKKLRKLENKEKHILKKEIETKNKELTNFALHLAKRNEFLTEVKKELASASKHLENPKAKESIKGTIVKIIQYVSHRKTEEDFLSKVEEVNESFFKNLSMAFPDLNDREKNLCALIRLKLASKEIAAFFNINSKSVNMNRYRLRKKLNISQEQDLGEFLEQF